jgi:hypothetical protein
VLGWNAVILAKPESLYWVFESTATAIPYAFRPIKLPHDRHASRARLATHRRESAANRCIFADVGPHGQPSGRRLAAYSVCHTAKPLGSKPKKVLHETPPRKIPASFLHE